MTQERDIEHLLDRWLGDGVTVAADRVIDVVADRIERQPQRPAWRLRPWRENHVNTYIKSIAALAAILGIVVVVAFNLLPASSRGVAGPAVSAEPSPTPTAASPHPSATATACEDGLPGCAGPLQPGRHVSVNFASKLVYTTPSGWTNSIDTSSIFKLDPPAGTQPYILIWSNVAIAEQTPACGPIPKPRAGRGVQHWVDFLTSHPGLDTTAPVPVDFVGGKDANGQSIDVAVAADWTATCPGSADPTVTLIAHTGEPPAQYGVSANQRLHLTILDVGGETVIIEVYGPKAPASFASNVAIAQPLIASFRFGCGPSVPRPCGF